MNRKVLSLIAIMAIVFVSCGQSVEIQGFGQVVAAGKMPLEYINMVRSGYLGKPAYEVSLRNVTSDMIISFDYSMVLFDKDGQFVSYEDKNFGGNNISLPNEQFSILSKLESEADQVRFLLKSVSWKETSSGAMFKWGNPGYDDQMRSYRLKGLKE